MSAGIGVDPGAPNLNLTSEEKRVYGQLFRQADGDSAGVVTGEVAVKFFEKTRLDSRVLGEIWQIADKENRGFLTPTGFGVVLRLIGHAQAGKEPTPDLALQQGPIPRFEGLWPPQSPSQPLAQPQSSGAAIRIPPLTPDKVAQYSSLFERQNLQGGYLPGEQARSIFDKSGLANETLGRIWGLADTDQRGALALPEFIIAMHLLTSTKTGSLRALPNVLPPGLYEAASRPPPAAAARQSPSSTGMPAAIPRQLSGSAQQRNGSPLGRPPLVAQVSGPSSSSPSHNNNNNSNNNQNNQNNNNNNNSNNDWAITPQEKVKFDQIFEGFDKTGRGFITGEEAVPFLSQSQLPEDTLAQIWDLADFDSNGRLTRDGFAVAMYLIRQQRNNRAPLPSALPQALIPPHRRNQGQTRPATAMSSAFDPPQATIAVAPPPKSALDDLFGLDSSSPSPAMAPTQTTMSTGGSNVNMNDPFGSGSSALRPSSPPTKSASPNVSSFKPFQPSSSFGRGLTGQGMGDSGAHRSLSEDLLGDNDHEASKKISEDASELANLSNQISSLTKQTQDLGSKRATTQVELNQTNSQKQNFEQRLAQLRQQYEKEAQDTHSLEERLRTSRSDTHKLRGECMTLEGQLRDVQGQHQQVLSAFQTDQQENIRLRDRIRAVSAEISQLKPQIEKLKMEARQQKGFVAINKKQLSTTEGERDKLRSEVDALARSVDDISRQAESGSPASASAQLASPSPSASSGNNPFFKRSGSADLMGVFVAQPPARTFDNTSFDDLFGPAGPSGSTGTPPPVFRQQHTGQSSASVGSYSNISASSPNVTRQAPQSADPPASSELRQLTSANLPFPEHNESLSSSTQVSPPTSRAEGSGAGSFPFPGGMTIAADAGKAPATANAAGDDADRSIDGAAKDITTVPAAQGGGGGGVGGGLQRLAAESDVQTAHGSAPFGSTDNAKAKEDFDNAFAAFASSKSPVVAAADASKPLAAFDSEFPPISELEREDSDSASEGGGFDDDFAPASPAAKAKESKSIASTSTPEPHHAHLDPSEATAASPKESSTLDGKSPELASSPATITRNNNSSSGPTTQASNVDDFFGSGTLTASSHQHGGASQTKGAFDDLDDDFEGLEDAKEGSADDDFANISRSGLDDFNPMFDSSPPASQAKTSGPAGSGSQQKGNPDWDAIFANLEAPSAATPPPAGAGNGNGAALVGITDDNAAAAASAAADSRPPVPGRALTEGGDHDDPLLKSLTSMGYARSTALDALEKYDYNLEKAANFLAGQS